MYDELVKRLRSEAVYLPEKFSKNAELLDVLMKAADAIEGLAHAVDQMTEWRKNPWIPVTERLPEDLTFVLAVEDGTVFMAHCAHYYGEEEVFIEWHDTMYYLVSPTHWMPLPEPPKEET